MDNGDNGQLSLPISSPTSSQQTNTTIPSPGSEVGVFANAAPYRGQQQTAYTRRSLAEVMANPQPIRWLVEGIYNDQGVHMLAGIMGIGKTWLVLALALAVATGGKWLGRFQCSQGRVLLVIEEDCDRVVRDRLLQLATGLEISKEQVLKLPIEFILRQRVDLLSKGKLNPAFSEHVQDLRPALVVLDTLRRVHNLNENDSRDMNQLFRATTEMVEDHDCACLFVHHLGKPNEAYRGTGLDRVRGSSHIAASMDSILFVVGEFGKLQLKHEKSNIDKPVEACGVVTEYPVRGGLRLVASNIERTDPRAPKQSARAGILRLLLSGPLNQSRLKEAMKPLGIGRSIFEKEIDLLESGQLVNTTYGPKNSKICGLTDKGLQAAQSEA